MIKTCDVKKMLKEHKNTILCFAINVVAFLVIYFLSSVYPFRSDDVWMMKNRITGEYNKSLSDVFETVTYYYTNWTGKWLSVLIVCCLVIRDKTIYNILNAFACVALCNIIGLFGAKKKRNAMTLAFTYIAIWIFTPTFGDLVLWCDGSVEYQWMMIPVLVYIYIYYETYLGNKISILNNKVLGCAFAFFVGVLAGCGLEATGCALALASAVYVFVKIYNKHKFHMWEIFGVIGFFVGFASLMLAPGNYNRADAVLSMNDRSTIEEYIFRIARESYYSLRYITPLLAISVALMILVYYQKKPVCVTNDKFIKTFFACNKFSLFFVFISFVNIYVMTFSVAFATRILYAPSILIILSILVSANIIYELLEASVQKAIRVSLSSILIIVSIYVLVQAFTCYVAAKNTNEPIIKDVLYTDSFNILDFN